MTSASSPRKLTVQEIISDELEKLFRRDGYIMHTPGTPKGDIYVEIQFNVDKFSTMVAKRIEDNQ